MSNLIDFDLQVEEPDEPEESEPELQEVRSTGRVALRRRSDLKLPHPPGPAGLGGPVTRLWIKRPPGPAGLV